MNSALTSEVLQDFQPYENPMFGLFKIPTLEYNASGWVDKEESYKIIGEADGIYVHELQELTYDEWVGDETVERKYIIPIGIHKTRLIKFTSGQLSFF